ncbi:DUF924 family protein [Ostreibacterium oceani]|uniref:DUF924 family protein n=1 Tax=Ostreibacterium oceani TaxID=2654998 RepID=A0A6N7EWZ1_9GAMM|nr:DUF924 family protein [Ostreibacterium oceani]MPV86443.1 DUF924 family protein [Ostreibacterium oceani]
MTYHDVIAFWFHEIDSKQWWIKDVQFDSVIRKRFGDLHKKANANELFAWRDNALGSLAEIIVLDQFSRHMYRDTALAFASDALALALSQQAIAKGFDQALPQNQRGFMYLPFMHSESSVIHATALELYESLGNPENIAFELKHKAIIDRFGRYPHRNAILGRQTTQEEHAFLTQPDSSF